MGRNKRLSTEGRGLVIVAGVFGYLILLAIIISVQGCGDDAFWLAGGRFIGCPIHVKPIKPSDGGAEPTPTPGGEENPTDPAPPVDRPAGARDLGGGGIDCCCRHEPCLALSPRLSARTYNTPRVMRMMNRSTE